MNWFDQVIADMNNDEHCDCNDDYTEQETKPVPIPKKLSIYLCPNCNAPVVIRESKYGEFVGCSNYPKCKYSASITGFTRSVCGIVTDAFRAQVKCVINTFWSDFKNFKLILKRVDKNCE